MESSQIRQAFLSYFEDQGHTVVASSSLVPGNDPTLLFTNAGMVQFKDVFLGVDKRPYNRATTSQRCVRAGGKHNDLENVGYTARHHTFFEMLGNFSFGDYFKREAIGFAWTFLTQQLGIPAEKLWVTVFHEDQEAEDIWLKEIGVDAARFSRLGEKDNFWAMGDTGPCGPCTEIFYDHGDDVPGGPPGSPDEDGDRYIEIWNLVFMQFNRSADGSLAPLPAPSVDTGMGLERIAAVMQGVHSNYDIDLFQYLLRAAAKITGTGDHNHTSLKVIADHIRSCAFLVCDGVIPSNEGRGYVLRRIIRRAIRHGHHLGVSDAFFHKLVKPLSEVMGEAYPELVKNLGRTEEVLLAEESQFARTLDKGMVILDQAIAGLSDKTIPGDIVFRLYDTYGFPVDLTADIARERGLNLDIDGFDTAMAAQKHQARSASRFESGESLALDVAAETVFRGYELLDDRGQVTDLFVEGVRTGSLSEGDTGIVILDTTPFYAESGGQVGDTGFLQNGNGRFRVDDTRKQGKQFLHSGVMETGTLTAGDTVQAVVDTSRRRDIMLNHSATHLMHAALRQVLGEHVEQKGSLVCAEYLRFDFSHNQPVSTEDLQQVEDLVNAQILANEAVSAQTMSIDEARGKGAMMLFGEKYGDVVRVIAMGKGQESHFSVELCGGTHVNRTGDIGIFRITQESGIAAGVRRIEALTGRGALQDIRQRDVLLEQLSSRVKTPVDSLGNRIDQVLQQSRQLEKEIGQLKSRLASSAGSDLTANVVSVGDIKVLAEKIDGLDGKALRETMDQLKSRLGRCVVVLGSADADRVSLVAGVSKDLVDTIKAGDVVNHVAAQVGGKGGGRPDMAMAGGSLPEKLPEALESVQAFVNSKL